MQLQLICYVFWYGHSIKLNKDKSHYFVGKCFLYFFLLETIWLWFFCKIRIYYFKCINVFPASMYVQSCASRCQKMSLDLLELQLQMFVSCQVGSANWAQVLCKGTSAINHWAIISALLRKFSTICKELLLFIL